MTIVAEAPDASSLFTEAVKLSTKGQKQSKGFPMRERRHLNPECNGHALGTHRALSMREAELEKVSTMLYL